MQKWIEKINKATTEKALNTIIESAAWDESITDREYSDLYEMALSKLKEWNGH